MQLPLVQANAAVLRETAKQIKDPATVTDLASDLLATMVAEGGVGLAAPQVGRGVRLFVTNVAGQPLVFINPTLAKASKEEIWWEEGCLSLPRLLGQVKRPKQVTVRALSETGQRREITADDLLARVIQHELDHLNGILFPDRVEDLGTLRYLNDEEWQSRFAIGAEAAKTEM